MAKSTKVAKASSSQAAAKLRRKIFAERLLVNGENASEAARFAGFSEKTSYSKGHELLKDPTVIELLGNRREALLVDAQLTTERWAKEMACIGHLDPGELCDEAGNLIPLHLLPEHVRRAIGSVETVTDKDGKTTMKLKPWDKNAALGNIGKHLGMFEKDNTQKTPNIRVLVQLVG